MQLSCFERHAVVKVTRSIIASANTTLMSLISYRGSVARSFPPGTLRVPAYLSQSRSKLSYLNMSSLITANLITLAKGISLGLS